MPSLTRLRYTTTLSTFGNLSAISTTDSSRTCDRFVSTNDQNSPDSNFHPRPVLDARARPPRKSSIFIGSTPSTTTRDPDAGSYYEASHRAHVHHNTNILADTAAASVHRVIPRNTTAFELTAPHRVKHLDNRFPNTITKATPPRGTFLRKSYTTKRQSSLLKPHLPNTSFATFLIYLIFVTCNLKYTSSLSTKSIKPLTSNTLIMPARAFHPTIDEVFINFHVHPTVPQATANMNIVYAFGIPFVDLLLPNGSSWNDSATVIDTVLTKINDHVNATAHHTADKTRIPPLIKSCTLRYNDEHAASYKTVRTPSQLENAVRALERKFRNGTDLTLNLYLNFAHWYVDTSKPIDVCDFSIFDTAPFPVPANPNPIPNQAAANNPALDPGVIALIQQLDVNAKQFTKALIPPKHPGASTHPFIGANFPLEVRERRTLRLANYVYPCLTDLQPFQIGANQALFYLDPLHMGTSFVALDGTYFVLEDQGSGSEKNFRTTANKCVGTTTYDVYNWYTTFTDHCARFGKYCHPYPCFNGKCSDPRGFAIGNGPDDDVSLTFETKIIQDSRLIWDVLRYIFTDHATISAIVDLHDGKGYEAIHSILSDTHPLIVPDPTSLVSARPKQGNLSISEYFKSYNHFLMLRALVENNPHNITNAYELKHFIHGCKHSTFLETEVRREEHITSLQHKFEPQNIVNTLSGYLRLSNSPSHQDRPYDSFRGRRRSDYNRRDTRDSRNASARSEYSKTSDHRYGKRTSDSRYGEPKKIQKIQTIEDDDSVSDDSYGDTEYDDNLDYAYSVSVHAIKNNPTTADMPCLVCEIVHGKPPSDGHRFENCTVLNNHSLLKKQFISFCSTIRRSRKALKNQELKRLKVDEATASEPDDRETSSDESSPNDADQDFPPGRY